MMRDIYENVWATTTLRDLTVPGNSEFNTVVGSIGFDWFSREHKMHYSGPGASWWGSDIAVIPFGKGALYHFSASLDRKPEHRSRCGQDSR